MIRLAIIFCLLGGMATAQACGDRSQIVAQLVKKYGEAQRGVGLAGRSGVIELWTGQDESFTILLTYPSDKSCVVAAGSGWFEIEQDKGEKL